jgi:hypothetical protein
MSDDILDCEEKKWVQAALESLLVDAYKQEVADANLSRTEMEADNNPSRHATRQRCLTNLKAIFRFGLAYDLTKNNPLPEMEEKQGKEEAESETSPSQESAKVVSIEVFKKRMLVKAVGQ